MDDEAAWTLTHADLTQQQLMVDDTGSCIFTLVLNSDRFDSIRSHLCRGNKSLDGLRRLGLISANAPCPRCREGDAAPFPPPNRGVMCCGNAGGGCQNTGFLSGQLFREVLAWTGAAGPAPSLTPRSVGLLASLTIFKLRDFCQTSKMQEGRVTTESVSSS